MYKHHRHFATFLSSYDAATDISSTDISELDAEFVVRKIVLCRADIHFASNHNVSTQWCLHGTNLRTNTCLPGTNLRTKTCLPRTK